MTPSRSFFPIIYILFQDDPLPILDWTAGYEDALLDYRRNDSNARLGYINSALECDRAVRALRQANPESAAQCEHAGNDFPGVLALAQELLVAHNAARQVDENARADRIAHRDVPARGRGRGRGNRRAPARVPVPAPVPEVDYAGGALLEPVDVAPVHPDAVPEFAPDNVAVPDGAVLPEPAVNVAPAQNELPMGPADDELAIPNPQPVINAERVVNAEPEVEVGEVAEPGDNVVPEPDNLLPENEEPQDKVEPEGKVEPDALPEPVPDRALVPGLPFPCDDGESDSSSPEEDSDEEVDDGMVLPMYAQHEDARSLDVRDLPEIPKTPDRKRPRVSSDLESADEPYTKRLRRFVRKGTSGDALPTPDEPAEARRDISHDGAFDSLTEVDLSHPDPGKSFMGLRSGTRVPKPNYGLGPGPSGGASGSTVPSRPLRSEQGMPAQLGQVPPALPAVPEPLRRSQRTGPMALLPAVSSDTDDEAPVPPRTSLRSTRSEAASNRAWELAMARKIEVREGSGFKNPTRFKPLSSTQQEQRRKYFFAIPSFYVFSHLIPSSYFFISLIFIIIMEYIFVLSISFLDWTINGSYKIIFYVNH